MMLNIKKGYLHITEQTVRELLAAIEKVKETTVFTDDPMPDYDMTPEARYRMKKERGEITVSSPYSPISFIISLETKPHTQESLGFKNGS